MDEQRVTYFAETDARNRRLKFGIRANDRTRHVYIIGKTGMGKSTLLENLAVQDIQNGEGLCFIDPHGKTADLLLEYVPENRIKDVILIAPFDVEHPISFNVLESVDHTKRHLVASGLMSTFKKIWEDAWSARMEYILTNTLLALLEAPNTTLLGVNKMLSDKEYRKEIISHVKDPSVRTFWTKEFANYTERMAQEAVPAIQNKVGQFTANPLIRNMIGQPQSSFDFRKAMDSKKILIINLSKGRIGDENMKLLGGMLVTKIYLAAMSRADVPDRVLKTLPNFYLFVDEFQNFANASFADILSEARKYKLNLTIAHQYVEQMDEQVRAAVFGNVGTMISFRVGATDAELLEKEFAPQFTAEDLVNLGFTQIYLKLMIDGLTSPPFSAVTLPPIPHPDVSFLKQIIDASREQFAKPRVAVEEEIIKFHDGASKNPHPPKSSGGSGTSVPRVPNAPVPRAGDHVNNNVPKPNEAPLARPNSERAIKDGGAVPTNSYVPKERSLDIAEDKEPGWNSLQDLKKEIPKNKQPEVARDQRTSSTAQPVHMQQKPNSAKKAPTANNVNALKEALSAIVKKDKAVAPEVHTTKQPLPVTSPKPEVKPIQKLSDSSQLKHNQPSINHVNNHNSAPVKPEVTNNISKDEAREPEEVPEDVLKKVLKLEE